MTKSINFGFTLIEILVVATIIGLLAAGATISYTSLTKQGRDAKRKADLEQIRAALEMYRSNNDKYIATNNNDVCSSNLIYLTTPPNIYLQRIPTDPKYPTYYYRCDISQQNFTLGAYLESGGTNCSGNPSCGAGIICNYCLGPYGQR